MKRYKNRDHPDHILIIDGKKTTFMMSDNYDDEGGIDDVFDGEYFLKNGEIIKEDYE